MMINIHLLDEEPKADGQMIMLITAEGYAMIDQSQGQTVKNTYFSEENKQWNHVVPLY